MRSPTFNRVDTPALCPHCRKELTTINVSEKGFINMQRIYSCPWCRCLLSIGYSWMA